MRSPRMGLAGEQSLHAPSVEPGSAGDLGRVEVVQDWDDEGVPGVEGGIVVGVEDLAGVVNQASGCFFEAVGLLADVGDRGDRDGAALE
jgi:hypothetical protein